MASWFLLDFALRSREALSFVAAPGGSALHALQSGLQDLCRAGDPGDGRALRGESLRPGGAPGLRQRRRGLQVWDGDGDGGDSQTKKHRVTHGHIYIYVYMYIYMYVYIYIYIYIYMFTNVCMYVWMDVCMYVCSVM